MKFFNTKGCLIIISLILTYISCTNRGDEISDDEILSLNIDDIISDSAIHYSDIFSGVHFVPLETREECLINEIFNLKLIEDTIYILDRSVKTLFVFSKEGKFINKINKFGRGPGEYLEPVDFDVDHHDKFIYILDWGLKKVNIYDTKCIFQKKVDIKNRFSGFSLLGTDFCLYMPLPESHDKNSHSLIYLLTTKGKVKWESLKSTDFLRGPNIVHFTRGGNFYKSGSDVKFHMNFSNKVFIIKSNSVQSFIELQTEKYKLNHYDLDKFTYDNFSFFELGKLNKLTNIRNYSDNQNLAFFIFDIGFDQFKTFYFFRTNKIYCSSRYIDDMTSVYPGLFKIFNNKLIAYLDSSTKLSRLKDLIRSDKIEISDTEKKQILQCPDNNNPIIIFFDVKEN